MPDVAPVRSRVPLVCGRRSGLLEVSAMPASTLMDFLPQFRGLLSRAVHHDHEIGRHTHARGCGTGGPRPPAPRRSLPERR
jgi:hypothetical protein